MQLLFVVRPFEHLFLLYYAFKISFSCTSFAICRTQVTIFEGLQALYKFVFFSFLIITRWRYAARRQNAFSTRDSPLLSTRINFIYLNTCTHTKIVHSYFFRSASFGIFMQHDVEENRISSPWQNLPLSIIIFFCADEYIQKLSSEKVI